MKFRSLAFLLPLGGLITLPLSAQAPADSNAGGTLQLQQTPVPAATPSAPAAQTNPAPEATQPAGVTNSAPAAKQAAPSTSSEPPAPASDSGLGSPGQNPPPSDPNSLIPPPVEPEQASPINTAGNEEKQRQEQKARYYSVKVKADKDDDLVSLQNKADKSKNEEAKRQALREYYDLLAARMKKLDPDLSTWIDTMHSAYLRRLQQLSVEPTIPLTSPPSVEALSSPTPSETPSHHRKKKKITPPAAN